MTIKLATIITSLPPALCGIVWDYEAGEEAELVRRERELDESEKSPALKARWQLEYDRNLRIFWNALLGESKVLEGHVHYTYRGAFADRFQHFRAEHPGYFDAADTAFCELSGNYQSPTALLPATAETANSIRKILQNPDLQEHFFSKVTNLRYEIPTEYYLSAHAGELELAQTRPPLLMVAEVRYFPGLQEIDLSNAHLVGPVDLRPLSNLDTVDIQQSNLTAGDLLLSHRVNAYTAEHKEGETIGPSCLESWANWIVSACQRFIAWACSWFT